MPDGLVLHPRGRLDLESSGPLRQRLAHAFASGLHDLVIELDDIEAVDPAGIGVLSGAARHLQQQGGSLVLRHPQPDVASVLRVYGLGDLLEATEPRRRPASPAQDGSGQKPEQSSRIRPSRPSSAASA